MNIKALSFSLILSLHLPFHADATGNEPIKATVAEARTRAKAHHALLKAKGKEVESARALLRQERLFENPEVAAAEVMRLRSQYVQLLRERGEVEARLTALQQSIALMLGTDAEAGIIPQVDYEATVALLSEIELHDLVGDLSNRPDMQSFRHDMASAAHDIKLQKANAWPTVSLTDEWDKNGSIGRNFFAVGLTMTLPLFNQNQGNIRAARATLEAKQMEYEWQRNQAASKLDQDWKQLQSSLRIADEAARHLSAANEGLMQQMERMYLARNISLLELIDYYQAYKDNHFLLIDSREKVLSLMAEMDLEIK